MSFMSFLGFTDPIQAPRTIWLFKERMAETGKDELSRQSFIYNGTLRILKVRRGTIQDSTFIEVDHGSSTKPRGEGAKTRHRGLSLRRLF